MKPAHTYQLDAARLAHRDDLLQGYDYDGEKSAYWTQSIIRAGGISSNIEDLLSYSPPRQDLCKADKVIFLARKAKPRSSREAKRRHNRSYGEAFQRSELKKEQVRMHKFRIGGLYARLKGFQLLLHEYWLFAFSQYLKRMLRTSTDSENK